MQKDLKIYKAATGIIFIILFFLDLIINFSGTLPEATLYLLYFIMMSSLHLSNRLGNFKEVNKYFRIIFDLSFLLSTTSLIFYSLEIGFEQLFLLLIAINPLLNLILIFRPSYFNNNPY